MLSLFIRKSSGSFDHLKSQFCNIAVLLFQGSLVLPFKAKSFSIYDNFTTSRLKVI